MIRELQRPRPRIESLTDLIFGLALSIGALILINNKPTSTEELLTSVGLFGFSFLILISIWLRYTETMSVLPVETSGTRALNVGLLFLVALEPYLFNLIGAASTLSQGVATIAYAMDIGSIYAILASFNHFLTSEGRVLVERNLVHKYRTVRNLQIAIAMLFWVSIIPQFYSFVLPVGPYGLPLRYVLWIGSFFLARGKWIMSRFGRL